MTREALAAALKLNAIDDDGDLTDDQWELIDTAARERLAQLPEKCEHDPFGETINELGGCDRCGNTGKVYPAELVERIALVLFPISGLQEPDGHIEAFRVYAVAVLDALNEETT